MIARVGYHYDAKDNPRSEPEDLKSHYNLPLELKEKRLIRKLIKKKDATERTVIQKCRHHNEADNSYRDPLRNR